MYLEHYGLAQPPFSITPDPRFVFLSERHRDALAHLRYGIEQGGGGGFVQLTGEVGTGKTTLSRLLLEQLADNVQVALILNPTLAPLQLLQAIADELGIATPNDADIKALIDALNQHLLAAHAQGNRVVLLLDEAQNLSADALEQVRLLTNLETDTQKLLQIVLLGQPELRDKLARPDLRQLAQRITARFHLTPLAAEEVHGYLHHRWRVAGGSRFPFDAAAVRALGRYAGGVPRLINVLAERALLAGYAQDAPVIGRKHIDLAAREVLPSLPTRRSARTGVMAVAAVLMAALLAWWWWPKGQGTPLQAPSATPLAGAAQTHHDTPAPAATAAQPRQLDSSQALASAVIAAGASPLPAWQAMLQAWELPMDALEINPDGSCVSADASVHCRYGRSSLDTLLQLDRPALLRLHASGGHAWVKLLGADRRRVRLQLAGEPVEIARGLLQQHWDGRFASLWRSDRPLDDGGVLTERWVHQRLAAQPAADAELSQREAILRFQRAHGLYADGLAGPDTLMALAADLPGPHLLRVLD